MWGKMAFLVFTLFFGSGFWTQYNPQIPEQSSFAEPVPPVQAELILRHDTSEWRYDLHQAGFDGIDPTTLDHEAVHEWIREVVEPNVNLAARSARYESRRMVAHRVGQKVDHEQIEYWLDQIHEVMNRPQAIPFEFIQPALTVQKLSKLKGKKLAKYTTYFNPSNTNRSHNIWLSAKAIDHKVVMPGEVFSFNQTVGKRTKARGYRESQIIVRGEFSEGVGGGICQTSSTLFNSADAAGLKIIQKISHSKKVAYVPPGRDATVSWKGPDFRFQNQLNEPILIVADVYGGRITVSIYGPKGIRHWPRFVPPPPKSVEDVPHVEDVQ